MSKHKIPYYRRQIGLIFQDNDLLLDRTVFDNVVLSLVISGENHREFGRRVRASLDKVSLLGRNVVSSWSCLVVNNNM